MSLGVVAVVGSGSPHPERDRLARQVGATVARAGAALVCGGRGGVMAAACAGAREVLGPHSGRIVGLLPGTDATGANPDLDLALPTGLGEARNVLVVRSAHAVVAVGGGAGTLSEIALAWKLGRPLAAYVGGGGWSDRLAGAALDESRRETIAELRSVAELEQWLLEQLPGR